MKCPSIKGRFAKRQGAGRRCAHRKAAGASGAAVGTEGSPARWALMPCVSAGLAAQAGLKRVEANIMSRVKKGKMKEAAAKAALGLLTGTLTYDDFGSVDMVRAGARGAPQPRCRVRRARPRAWSTSSGGAASEGSTAAARCRGARACPHQACVAIIRRVYDNWPHAMCQQASCGFCNAASSHAARHRARAIERRARPARRSSRPHWRTWA